MSNFMKGDKLTLEAKDAAMALNISMPTLYQLIQIEGFPAIHIGKKILVDIDGLLKWMRVNYGRNVLEGESREKE